MRVDLIDAARLIGDGDGEVRFARRRSRSRPPGVLRRASRGDLGGQFSFAFAASQLDLIQECMGGQCVITT